MLTKTYNFFYELHNGDPFQICVIAGTIWSLGWWIVFNSFFFYLDIFEPKWAQHYRIQEDKKPTFSKYFSALKVSLINICIVGPTTMMFWFYISQSRGMIYSLEELPSWLIVFRDLIISLIIEELGFYYTHRLFHHPNIYKYIHKKHHEWTAPVSITSVYCHPIEHAVSNVTPVVLGPLLCGSHITTLWIWSAIALLSTTSSHSGYHFPLQPSPEPHDYHHKVFNECFGVLGWLDDYHQTNLTFKESIHSQRNKIIILGDPKKVFPKND